MDLYADPGSAEVPEQTHVLGLQMDLFLEMDLCFCLAPLHCDPWHGMMQQ